MFLGLIIKGGDFFILKGGLNRNRRGGREGGTDHCRFNQRSASEKGKRHMEKAGPRHQAPGKLECERGSQPRGEKDILSKGPKPLVQKGKVTRGNGLQEGVWEGRENQRKSGGSIS